MYLNLPLLHNRTPRCIRRNLCTPNTPSINLCCLQEWTLSSEQPTVYRWMNNSVSGTQMGKMFLNWKSVRFGYQFSRVISYFTSIEWLLQGTYLSKVHGNRTLFKSLQHCFPCLQGIISNKETRNTKTRIQSKYVNGQQVGKTHSKGQFTCLKTCNIWGRQDVNVKPFPFVSRLTTMICVPLVLTI